MRHKRFPPTDPREWLRRARSNLVHSRAEADEVDLAELCFDAQQAAEKAIKAVFIHRGEAFPFTHDLEALIRLLKAKGQKVPKYVEAAKVLTRFAVVARYPDFTTVTRGKYGRSVRIASAVLRWAERQIAPPSKRKRKP